MLNNVSQISSIINNNITLKHSGKISALPKENSIVFLEIIEKKGDVFRILIDGKVFQSKLPFNVNEGDQLFAKVLSKEPFTLVVNDFGKAAVNNNAFISTVLVNFELKDSEFNRTLIDKIVSSKKVLSKSKLKRIVEYFESTGQKIEDLQLSLLVQIFWSFEKEKDTIKYEELNRFLKNSFEDLAANLKFLIIELNNLYPNELITRELNSIFLFRIPFTEKRFIDRDKKIFELIELIESAMFENTLINPDKLSELKEVLLLYLIQKSFYNYYSFYPDFLILEKNNDYEIVIYFLEPMANNLGILSFELKYSLKTENEELGFEGILSHDSINFNVYSKAKSFNRLSEKLNSWTSNLEKDLEVKVNATIRDPKNKIKDGTIIGVNRSINVKA